MHPFQEKYDKFKKIAANVTYSVLVVCIFAERAHSFKESQAIAASNDSQIVQVAQASPTKELSGTDALKQQLQQSADEKKRLEPSRESLLDKRFAHLKTKLDACRELEGKVVSYYDQVSLVKNCQQHLFENQDHLNSFLAQKGGKFIEVPARIYRMIPFGSVYEPSASSTKQKRTAAFCQNHEGKYYTTTGHAFYIIDDCKKRLFKDYPTMQEHNTGNKPVSSVAPEILENFPAGKSINVKSDWDKIAYGMDGEIRWSRAGRTGGKPIQDTEEHLEQIGEDAKRVPKQSTVCQKYDKRIISFYSKIYYVDKCKRRPVADFSLELQQFLEQSKGVRNIASDEYKVLPEGKSLGSKELIQLLE